MVKAGRHPDKALTTVKVRQASKPGRYADGNGLYLVVDPSGARRWLLRTVVQGRRRDIGLGGATLVSLAEAREAALSYRKTARSGGDPLLERKQARITVPTFADAARTVHGEHKAVWKNGKHAAQWLSTLEAYALPLVGARRVDELQTPDLLRVLAPIWLTKPETARRVRQRMGTVFDWAKAAGYRAGENPIYGVERGLPKQADQNQHHAAMPYTEVPGFITRLHTTREGEIARLAFEFLILTAARTGEVLAATWQEIDHDERLWIVPAERMKAKRQHRVPLVKRSFTILIRARELGCGSKLVFPGRSGDKPMSNMVFLMSLRRMNVAATSHGFRSAFRDWAAEETNFPREIAEMALAHTIESKVEAAYRRGDLLAKRREMMIAWADFTSSECTSASG